MKEEIEQFLKYHNNLSQSIFQRISSLESDFKRIIPTTEQIEAHEKEVMIQMEKLFQDIEKILKIAENHYFDNSKLIQTLEEKYHATEQLHQNVILDTSAHYQALQIRERNDNLVKKTNTNEHQPRIEFWKNLSKFYLQKLTQFKCKIQVIKLIQKRYSIKNEFYKCLNEIQNYDSEIEKLVSKRSWRFTHKKKANKIMFQLDRKLYQLNARLEKYQNFESEINTKIIHYQNDIEIIRKNLNFKKKEDLLKQKVESGDLKLEDFEHLKELLVDSRKKREISIQIHETSLLEIQNLLELHQKELPILTKQYTDFEKKMNA